jgi:hypothetical protein
MGVPVMRAKPFLVVPLAVMIMVAGLGLKVSRYGKDTAPHSGDVMVPAAAVMAANGWQRTGDVPFGVGMPLVAATFAKPGCESVATVTRLGKHVELQDYVRLRHRGNVEFMIERGSAPSDFERQLGNAMGRLGLGSMSFGTRPLLAVSPEPTDAVCSPPRRLGRANLINIP